METTRIKIAALWVVVMINMAFADIVGFIHPGALQRIMDGSFGFQLTQPLLLLFTVLLVIPSAMIFLSLVLPLTVNRWVNTVVAVVTALYVIGGGSTTLSYYFFASVEIVCMGVILWYAWRELSSTK